MASAIVQDNSIQEAKTAFELAVQTALEGRSSIEFSSFRAPQLPHATKKALFLHYETAAEAGNVEAHEWVGWCLHLGFGVKQCLTKAFKWFLVAAESGSVVGQAHVGYCYDNGEGVDQDHSKAPGWYVLAAEAGHLPARYNLGLCYQSGSGVVKDQNRAVELFRQAADLGYAAACTNLGYCYENGLGVKEDHARAFALYMTGGEGGDAVAQFNLGNCYRNGLLGSLVDVDASRQWFEKSAAQGDQEALEELREEFWIAKVSGCRLDCGDGWWDD